MDCNLPGSCTWDFPGKNIGVGCYFPLQGILLTQRLNPRLLHWQVGSLPLSHKGSPDRSLDVAVIQSHSCADSLQPHGLQHARPPCPSPTPGLTYPAVCRIFSDQGSNPCPLHWQVDSYPQHPQGSPSVVFEKHEQSIHRSEDQEDTVNKRISK